MFTLFCPPCFLFGFMPDRAMDGVGGQVGQMTVQLKAVQFAKCSRRVTMLRMAVLVPKPGET